MFKYLFLLFIIISLLSCSSNSNRAEFIPIKNIVILDNGNTGNGSDIEINFDKQLSPQGILEYRVYLIPTELSTSFDIETVEDLGPELYTSSQYADVYPIKGIQLNSTSKSVDGTLIMSGIKYDVLVLTVADKSEEFNNSYVFEAKSFELTNNNQINTFVTFPDTVGAGNISIDSDGILYVPSFNVLDELSFGFRNPSSIFRITSSASRSTLVDKVEGQIGSIFIDDSNLLYPVLRSSQQIGNLQTTENEIEPITYQGYEMDDPVGIYVNPDKNIFVTDKERNTIIKITPDGDASLYASVLSNPRGITGDESGNLYISHDNQDGTITKISPDGSTSLFANIPTYKPEEYTLPYAMWVGHINYHNEHLYVCGMSTDRVYKISMSGAVEVFAGSGERGIPRGGATTAKLNRPYGLAWSNDGTKLYISGSGDLTPQHVQGSLPGKIWVMDIVEQ